MESPDRERERPRAPSGGSRDPRAKEIFLDALDLPGEQRAAFVERAAGGDVALRRDVLALLAAHERAATRDERSTPDPLRPFVARPSAGLEPGARIGPYVVERQLGEGGFGLVYLARQEQPVRRRVALKVQKRGFDGEAVLRRFEAERQALARMDHPSVCRIFDAGATEDGRPWFCMELFEGLPITRWCDERRLALERRVEIFGEVCQAIEHAHQKGVLHRDLKPSNVLVAEVGGRAMVKVIDFGIAKALDDPLTGSVALTREGLVLGTPAYMSPEQSLGSRDVDTRTDVWGLGALLYELVAGEPPFGAEGVAIDVLLARIRDEDPARPSRRAAARADGGTGVGAVPPELDWIVLRCLEKDQGRRYPSAAELSADLERFRRGAAVEAAPPSRWYAARKLVARHRLAFASGLALLVSLVAGVVGTTRGMLAAEREAANARDAERRAEADATRALREQRVASAVLEFLDQDLLAAASPSDRPGRGRDATLREVVDAASARLEAAAAAGSGRFAGEPAVEARIRSTLGGVFHALGEFERAELHLRRSLEIASGALGERSREALAAACALAVTLRHRGSLDEADAVLARVLAEPLPDDLRAAALLALGQLRTRQSRLPEAIAALEEALAIHERAAREQGEDALRARNALAIAHERAGDAARAGEVFRRTHELRSAALGPEHPATLAAAVNLAAACLRGQRLDEAEALLVPTVEAMRRVLGPGHRDTAEALINLGILYRTTGRADLSLRALEEARAILVAALGPDHPDTLSALDHAVRTLSAAGRLDEAEPLAEELVERAERALPERHALRSSARTNLAEIWILRGVHAERVVELLAANLADDRARLGPDHENVLRAMVNLATYSREHDPAGSEALFREAVERTRRAYGAEHQETLLNESALSGHLLALGRTEEALELAAHAAEVGARVLDPKGDELAVLELRHGVALCEHGRLDEAEPLLLRAHARLVATRHAGAPLARGAAKRLAQIYETRGDAARQRRWQQAAAGDLAHPDHAGASGASVDGPDERAGGAEGNHEDPAGPPRR